MIKICRDRREVKKYKELSFIMNPSKSIPQLTLNTSLFLEARKIFSSGNKLIEVQKIEDGNQKEIFYLKMHRDRIENSEGVNIEVDVNFKGYDLLSEKNLDVRLLEKAECYVFEELEEYTYELTKFIRKSFPEAYIFFLDSYANYFWDSDNRIQVIKSLYDINIYWDNKYMFITSDGKNHECIVPESSVLIYNSVNVINSLCWAKTIEKFGNKNNENIILLIDIGFGVECGLAYIIRTVCTFAYMAQTRGWIPVVNLTGENMYIDIETKNMWEQFFESLSRISVTEALESKKVISLKNNHLNAAVIYINPYFREIWHKTNIHPEIKLKNNLVQYFEQSWPHDFQSENLKILGVLIRGTDARKLSEEEVSGMISDCMEIMEDDKFDRIFLATEDDVVFSAFKNVFKNKLIYIEQRRVSNHEEKRKLVGELLNIKKGEKEKFGQTYLLITYCLSHCDAFVYNIASGGHYLANKWRDEPYRFTCQIDGKSTEIDRLIERFRMFGNNSMIIIYGTGVIGEKMAEFFKYRKDLEIVFCDRKAGKAEFDFCGYRVISPALLLKKYKENKVQGIIVTSVNYSDEIYHSLVMDGVNQDHILVINNRSEIF